MHGSQVSAIISMTARSPFARSPAVSLTCSHSLWSRQAVCMCVQHVRRLPTHLLQAFLLLFLHPTYHFVRAVCDRLLSDFMFCRCDAQQGGPTVGYSRGGGRGGNSGLQQGGQQWATKCNDTDCDSAHL